MTPDPAPSKSSRILALLFLLLAAVLTAAMGLRWQAVIEWEPSVQAWVWLTVGLSLFLGVMFLQSGWMNDRTVAVLRLDWFLPALKRMPSSSKTGASLGGRLLRKIAPSMQSDWKTKKRGWARRFLRKLGPSWVASPLRRISQAICFLLFCWLFFYVCWPYHATPAPVQDIGPLTFQSFDQAEGLATFQKTDSRSQFTSGQVVFLQTENGDALAGAEPQLLGEFSVESDDTDKVIIRPQGDLSPLLLDVITGGSDTRGFVAVDRDPFRWPDHYAASLGGKEFLPAETFLMIDPLVSLSTAIASRSWVWSLGCAAAILFVCVVIPRGFCGYLCPLGTTIDLFDWAIAGRLQRFRVQGDGWWVHIKYYLLAAVLLSAVGGILISGFVSAIPVVTRGFLFLLDPLQNGMSRGWHLVPSMNGGQVLSIALFMAVLCLGFLRPRFWCKYVCPSGAVFSLGNLFRATERKVESSCIHCNKCVEICPFDAIKPDFTTRTTDCTLCQSCAGVCPTHAIKFVERTNLVELKIANDPPTHETALGRRGFLSLATGTTASLAGAAGVTALGKVYGAGLESADAPRPVRPPGSVPEQEFLEMCIRCGECFKACPNNVLQPEGFQQGFEGLWTPLVAANWAGCESSCNSCGQVCPTGAIRALPMQEKRYARMGLAVVNESSCLPFAGEADCDLCVQDCNAAGYEAIEYTQVGVQVDENGQPIEGTGYAAPVVIGEKCVGCGLCQTRCYAINVKEQHLLSESAIIVETGPGKEDRLTSGSYKELYEQRQQSAQLRTPAYSERPQEDLDPLGIQGQPSESEADPFGISAPTTDDESPF